MEVKRSRRFLLPLAGIDAVLMLSVPFVLWYQTWFGRPLDDAEIGHYLNPESRPRDMQHAISQIAGRMERGDSRIRKLWRCHGTTTSRSESWRRGSWARTTNAECFMKHCWPL